MYIDYKKSLSEDFIRENKNKINWFWLSSCQKLNENFIREFQNEVYWKLISKYQILNENFISDFKDKVYWRFISVYQKLSINFLRKFQDKIDWNFILEKYDYDLFILNNKYQIKSINFNSDYLEYNEFIDLALKLISLKAFQ